MITAGVKWPPGAVLTLKGPRKKMVLVTSGVWQHLVNSRRASICEETADLNPKTCQELFILLLKLHCVSPESRASSAVNRPSGLFSVTPG